MFHNCRKPFAYLSAFVHFIYSFIFQIYYRPPNDGQPKLRHTQANGRCYTSKHLSIEHLHMNWTQNSAINVCYKGMVKSTPKSSFMILFFQREFMTVWKKREMRKDGDADGGGEGREQNEAEEEHKIRAAIALFTRNHNNMRIIIIITIIIKN